MSREDTLYNRRTDVSQCWLMSCCDKCGTDACNKSCKKFIQLDYSLQMSGLPPSKQHPIKLDTSMMDEQTADFLNSINSDIKFFVKCGFNLYLYGMSGVGKSSWSIKMLLNYLASICDINDYECHGLFINVPAFIRDSKLYFNNKDENFMELLYTIKNCDVVIWDDIYQTDTTAYESQLIYSYINDRLLADKCNIYTSNISPDELMERDSRLHSRICEGSDCINIVGMDMRHKNTYSNYIFNRDGDY